MSLCVACGSVREADRPHCPVCGAGESQAAALAGWEDDLPFAGAPSDTGGISASPPDGAGGQPAAGTPDSDDTAPPAAHAEADTAGNDDDGDDAGDGQERVGGAERLPPRWPGFVLVVVGLALIGGGVYTAYRNTHGHRLELPSVQPSLAPSPSALPSPTNVTVTTAPAVSGSVVPTAAPVLVAPALVGQPDVADIVQTLSAYFTAINTRDFETYRAVLVATDERVGSEADFRRRFRTTTDSQIRLVGIQRESSGRILATVTFRSIQDPVDAPDGVSSCVSWMLTYPVTRVDGAVRIDVVGLFDETHRPC